MEDQENKTKQIETYLPVFPGFYGTIFEADGEENDINDINQQRADKGLPEIDFDACEFNYAERNKSVIEDCVAFIEQELRYVFKSPISIKCDGLHSPREYNFGNDSINITVEVSNDLLIEIKTYLIDHFELFSAYIKERYSSRDGFMSFHSNDATEWLHTNVDKIDSNAHYLGAILEFICGVEEVNEMDMYEACNDMHVYATNYDELINN